MKTTDSNPPKLELRLARRDDIPILQHWARQPHVVAAGVTEDWGWETEVGREVDWREFLIATLDLRPIGFMQIIAPDREDSHYWGNVPSSYRAIDIWIGEASELGKGYGTAMMRLAINRCFRDARVTSILVDPLFSNARARRFYERLGFRLIDRQVLGGDDCAVYRLDRGGWEGGGRTEDRKTKNAERLKN